jgi:hypothetical protein
VAALPDGGAWAGPSYGAVCLLAGSYHGRVDTPCQLTTALSLDDRAAAGCARTWYRLL